MLLIVIYSVCNAYMILLVVSLCVYVQSDLPY